MPIILPEIVSEDFTPHFVDGLSNEEYHADKTAVSSTSLKTLLKSPATFYSSFLEVEKKQTPAMRLGTMIHMALLEPTEFLGRHVVEPEFGDQRSTINKQAKKDWHFELEQTKPGAIVVKESDKRRLEGIINSVMRHTEAAELIRQGTNERSGYYRDPVSGVKCRIRPDLYVKNLGVLIDVKSCQDCSLEEFSKDIWARRYDLSLANYKAGLELLLDQEFIFSAFLAVEKEPPYEVALYVADKRLMKRGFQDYQNSLLLLKDCLMNGTWPGYQTKNAEISLPHWVKE